MDNVINFNSIVTSDIKPKIKINQPIVVVPLGELSKVDITEYVKFTDYASHEKAGVVATQGAGFFGIYMTDTGSSDDKFIKIYRASEADIINKYGAYRPLTPSRLDLAVKVGVTTNAIPLTDEEKKKAQEWLGLDGIRKGLYKHYVKFGFLPIWQKEEIEAEGPVEDWEGNSDEGYVVIYSDSSTSISDISELDLYRGFVFTALSTDWAGVGSILDYHGDNRFTWDCGGSPTDCELLQIFSDVVTVVLEPSVSGSDLTDYVKWEDVVTEEWTYTLEDGTTVTKNVVVFPTGTSYIAFNNLESGGTETENIEVNNFELGGSTIEGE